MQRTDVSAKLAALRKEIKAIEGNDDPVVYATCNKYLPGAGIISEISNIPDIVAAHAEVLKQSKFEHQQSIEALGLTQAEIELIPSTVKILGYKPGVWFDDIKKRLAELRQEERLIKLKASYKKLKKWLSEDDQFELDTAGIDSLLTEA